MSCIFCLEETDSPTLTCAKHSYAVGSIWIEPLSCFEFLKAEFIPQEKRKSSLTWLEKDGDISPENPLRFTCYVCKKVSKDFESAHFERCRLSILLKLGYRK